MKRLYTLLSVVGDCRMATAASAQDHFTFAARDLPQSILSNPAMRPSRGFVSMPIFGSLSLSFDNSFSYNNIIKKNGEGVRYPDTYGLLKATQGNNLTLLRMNLALVNTGFFIGEQDYMGISLRTRVHVGTSLPDGLFGMILDNPIDEYKTFDISTIPNILGWAELGLSYTRDIDENWRVGGRVKYLNGVVRSRAPAWTLRLVKSKTPL